ncbi:TRM11 family SAM-dependent methyltransferase [Paenibacillus spongiae]|uniref:RNA methyltransferase n=1 Tax=Paenibacillus spongiae TaxID=2909671 RepID=A0ABY5S878_9BACL|nr:RNA methyltransferase [Paenibacillus spongiae]UVI30127.1 RNA methyltransferase [Paenibacillus spongiae]
MEYQHDQLPSYIYTYASPDEELSLCQLEMRTFFGTDAPPNLFQSPVGIDPSRSPFIRERIEVFYEGDSVAEIVEQVAQIDTQEMTFKVIFVKTNDLEPSAKIEFEEQRVIERELGWQINGEADVRNPDYVFGIVTMGGRWYFGNYRKSKTVWLQHQKKPRSYSIALPTRIARAAANIAVPDPEGIRAIDPCCGIGTVLVEALSMGIDIVGRDINPFICRGARENIAHFGYHCPVTLGSIADVTLKYDAAIIDMPYNHVSTISSEEQFDILRHARRIAGRVIVITIDPMDEMLIRAGFRIADRAVARKGSFLRHIIVCV